MSGWFEWAHMTLSQIEYIKEIHKGLRGEEHDIRMLINDSMDRIQRSDQVLGSRKLWSPQKRCK
jgi:hypothetical protein